MGSLTVAWISGTTNGTVRSIGASVTVPITFFSESTTNVTCTTAASPGTDIGTLTGSTTGTVELDVKAVLNCGFLLPSALWEGTYVLTVPGKAGEQHHIAVEA